ncbi:unnamed protein product, partial [Rotaria socialis]
MHMDPHSFFFLTYTFSLRVGGPIWLGPLFDHSFVNELITSIEQAPDD